MSNFSGISGVGLGSIGSSLGSYHGSRSSGSGGSGSSGGRSNQLVSMNLSEFVNTNVDDYEENEMARPDDFEIDRSQGQQKSWWDKFTDWAKETGANVVIGATSVLSGIADALIENVVDAGAFVVSEAASALGALGVEGADDFAVRTREFIARDLVGEANDALYGEGGWLEGVNNAASMKYDSELAQGIRNISEEATEFVIETGLTCIPGCGPALAAGYGAMNGLGEKAEETFREHGTETLGAGDRIRIWGAGVEGAFEGYFKGQMGTHLLSAFKSGIGKTAAQFLKNIPTALRGLNSPQRIVHALGTGWKIAKGALTNPMTHLTAAGMSTEPIINLLANWADTGEIDWNDVGDVGKKIALSYGTIFAFSFFGGVASEGLKNGRIDQYTAMQRDIRNYKDGIPADALDEKGRFNWDKYGPSNGGAVPGSEHPTTLQAGSEFDRYGGETGKYVSPIEDGVSVPYQERVLPYKESAAGLPSNYTVVNDITPDSLNAWFKGLDPKAQLTVLQEMSKGCYTISGGLTVQELISSVDSGAMTVEQALSLVSVDMSITASTIAPHALFGPGGGTATQIQIPLPLSRLKEAGFVEDLYRGLENVDWLSYIFGTRVEN